MSLMLFYNICSFGYTLFFADFWAKWLPILGTDHLISRGEGYDFIQCFFIPAYSFG